MKTLCRGSGETTSGHGEVTWKRGDLFVFPMTPKNDPITHRADDGAALYFVRVFPTPLRMQLHAHGCHATVRHFSWPRACTRSADTLGRHASVFLHE